MFPVALDKTKVFIIPEPTGLIPKTTDTRKWLAYGDYLVHIFIISFQAIYLPVCKISGFHGDDYEERRPMGC
jgi:hypothetical protein